MSGGIAEMNKAKEDIYYTHTDGITYLVIDAEDQGSCDGCLFDQEVDDCEMIDTEGYALCKMNSIFILKESPLATASAELVEKGKPMVSDVRTFDTGATRDTDEGKHDIEAFFSPLVTKRRAEYMHLHRKLGDGSMRDGDNWQLGMPYNECLKSLCRHVEDIKLLSRGYDAREDIETALCAVMFNCESMLLTRLESKQTVTDAKCASCVYTLTTPRVEPCDSCENYDMWISGK